MQRDSRWCYRLIQLIERDPQRGVRLGLRAQSQLVGVEYGWACLALGRAYQLQGRTAVAEATYAVAEQILEGQFDTTLAGLLRVWQCELRVAADRLQAWHDLAEQLWQADQPVAWLRAMFEQIAELNVRGKAEDALALACSIEAALREHGTAADWGRWYRLCGVAYTNVGQLEAGLAAHQHAIQSYQQAHRRIEVWRCWHYLAWTYSRCEDYGRARQYLELAIEGFRSYDLQALAAMSTTDLGVTLGRMGEFHLAFQLLYEADRQLREMNYLGPAANCRLNLGIICYYIGMFDMALWLYQQALEQAEQLKMDRLVRVARRNIAQVWRAQGQLSKAQQLLNGLVIELQQRDQLELAEAYEDLAEIWIELHQPDHAFVALDHAEQLFRQLGSRPGVSGCQLERALLLVTLGDCQHAGPLLVEVLSEFAQRPAHRWRVEHGLGRCASASRDSEQAQRWYRQAIITVGSMRQRIVSEHAASALLREANQLFADALDLAYRQQDGAFALGIAAQQRGLLSAYQHGRAGFEQLMASEHYRQVAQQAQVGQGDYAELFHLLLEQILQRRHAEPAALNEPPDWLDAATLCSQLEQHYPEGWVLLSYAEFGDDWLVIVLDRSGIQLERIICSPIVAKNIQLACAVDHRRRTYQGLQEGVWQLLEVLGEVLIPAQVRSQLHPDRRLLIVPSGELHGLAWSALRVQGVWLCEQAIVQILPGEAHWGALLQRLPVSQKGLLVGCGEFQGRALDLPNAVASLELVERHWPGACEQLVQQQASTTALMERAERQELASYGLLHIVSHAELPEQRSGLVAHIKLADADLFYDDLASLKLQGALVVLMTCEGALGEVLAGDEVLSLGRACILAGARDVIAGLWQIYDRVVLEVTHSLYRALAEGMDPPSALAATQRQMIRHTNPSYQLPLLWAGLYASGAGSVRR
jgi:tetratricopeptide (TPR) repeat protein